MGKVAAALLLLASALALTGAARADVQFGVAEDAGKYAPMLRRGLAGVL